MISADHQNLQVTFAIHAIRVRRQIRHVRLHMLSTERTMLPAITDDVLVIGIVLFSASAAFTAKLRQSNNLDGLSQRSLNIRHSGNSISSEDT
jgi:hypothetical protein